MRIRTAPAILFVLFLVYLAPNSGGFVNARSHHRHHNHHHATVSGSNNGIASSRNHEEAGALPFTESRLSSGEETLNTRSAIEPRFSPDGSNNVRQEGFPPPRPAYQQQQRQQNFNPTNIQTFNNNNNIQQVPTPNFYARVPPPFNAPKEKAVAGETGKWGSNHTIPFLKQFMGEVDDGKIKHHDYPALTWFLKYFAEQYPDITRLYSIGMKLLFCILFIQIFNVVFLENR